MLIEKGRKVFRGAKHEYIKLFVLRRLQENKERAEELEEEKQMYNEQAQELQSTIKVDI